MNNACPLDPLQVVLNLSPEEFFLFLSLGGVVFGVSRDGGCVLGAFVNEGQGLYENRTTNLVCYIFLMPLFL